MTRFAELSFQRIEDSKGGETLPPPLCGVATLISDVKWHPLEDKYSGSRHRCPSQRVVRTWSTFRAALFLPPVSRPLIANRKSPVSDVSLSLSLSRRALVLWKETKSKKRNGQRNSRQRFIIGSTRSRGVLFMDTRPGREEDVLLLDVQSISRMEISGQGGREMCKEDQLRRDWNSMINPLIFAWPETVILRGLPLTSENGSSILQPIFHVNNVKISLLQTWTFDPIIIKKKERKKSIRKTLPPIDLI